MVLGSLFAPISMSGAQTDDGSTDDSTQPGPDSPGRPDRPGRPDGDHRRGGPGRGSLDALIDLGLSLDDIKAGNQAGQTLVETAAAAGISEAELTEAIEASISEHLAEAVANGRIDSEQAAEIKATMSERISEQINTVHEGRPGHGQGRRGPGRQEVIETLTDLGIDEDALRSGREEGKTLAEVAAEAGISEDALVDALLEGAQDRLDEAKENGRIDDERLAEIEAGLEEKITEMVNHQPGEGRPGTPGEGRPGGFGGQGGAGPTG